VDFPVRFYSHSQKAIVNALALMLRPTRHGWAVYLTNGRELARFNGLAARWRALRYLTRVTELRKGD
jgi:hypothetical protein